MTAARLGRMSMLGFLLENENIQAALPFLPTCTVGIVDDLLLCVMLYTYTHRLS